ncbi:anti-anti-sigma factor [Streptomyces sp. MnatMP-M77]|uniref:STAS domain-containing protein n=1 Tax=unclassified Streptomyces TaxID=2593676 RepID=UPI000805D277|nr:STAS domain-containing protein [Streptomyces sp. MnatMP-M77]MYT82447.1 STAS domain-containing protein [Streptomyces sp. SID8364]SBU96679.1 anti-anti-sigma factor [Streptomyces sp. MnatMP-M77]
MATPLTLTVHNQSDGTALLKAVGEVDMSNTDALTAALDATPGTLIIDLTDVEYLDSAGLSVLFAHADRLEIIAGPLLTPVLTVSGLVDLTTIRRPDE